jgi:ASC-1-like (ASCH) protein
MEHQLKIQPEYYEAVRKRIKTFEIRRNDRNFQVGDILVLNEFIPETSELTGRWFDRKITYITDYAQQENYVVMSII